MDIEKLANRAVFFMMSFLGSVLLALQYYLLRNYQVYSFEQYLYSFLHVNGTSINAVKNGFYMVSLYTVIILIILVIITILNDRSKKKLEHTFTIKNKKRTIKFFPLKFGPLAGVIFLVVSMIYFCCSMGIFTYLINKSQDTTIYEDYYVDPKNVEISFNGTKRNLIYIYLESFESTFMSKINGGNVTKSYIPNLENIALNNLNFSQTESLGGASQLYGTGWTVAAMVAHMGGIPLTVDVERNEYANYSDFLPGAYMLGDILEKEGYHNYFMIGSEAQFGGRDDLVSSHGNYEIYDYFSAVNDRRINHNYYVWWGYEDYKLFDYAKDRLNDIASSGEPFNFTMLTADTHFTDGFLDPHCKSNVFDSQYADVYYCSDSMVSTFVRWIMSQPFYDNTTIVLVGDHLTMQSLFYGENPDYERTVFNTFINSKVEPINNKNREFSTFDFFPTTLAALGASISGDQLGFGVNLFSDKKTLIEELGTTYLNNELSKNSDFYNKYLLQDSYLEMQEVLKSQENEE